MPFKYQGRQIGARCIDCRCVPGTTRAEDNNILDFAHQGLIVVLTSSMQKVACKMVRHPRPEISEDEHIGKLEHRPLPAPGFASNHCQSGETLHRKRKEDQE